MDKEEIEDFEKFDDLEKDNNKKKKTSNPNKTKKILNIIFVVIFVIIMLITIDIVAVKKFDKGPFFAINLKTHKDTNTKEYYGVGYKVIVYNQFEGRKGKELGTWKLKYNPNPIKVDIIDLALQFENKKADTAKELNNEYIIIKGKISNVDVKNREVTITYSDEDNKYTLDVIAELTEDVILDGINENEEINILGTAYKFVTKSEKNPNKIYLKGCSFLKLS